MNVISANTKGLLWSMRCYNVLLYVYPRAFRSEFGPQLRQAFGDLSQQAMQSGRIGSVAGLWLRTLRDLFSSAVDQRFPQDFQRRFQWRWIAACAVGIPIGVCLLFVVTFFPGFFLRTWHWLIAPRPQVSLNREAIPLPSPRNAAFVVAEIAGIVAFAVGWLQSRVFGWKAHWRLLWIAATTVGVSVGWPALYFLNSGNVFWMSVVAHQPFVLPVKLLLCGAIIGLFQMAVLVCKTTRAWAWPPTCAAGMLVAGFLIHWMEGPSLGHLLLVPLMAGAVFGFATAYPLTWIMQSSSPVWQLLRARRP